MAGNDTSDGTRNDTSAHNGTGTDTAKRNPFEPVNHDSDDFVAVQVTYRNRERFTRWFEGQFKDGKPPRQSEWIDRVFELGLAEIERRLPPVESAEDRFKAALGAKS